MSNFKVQRKARPLCHPSDAHGDMATASPFRTRGLNNIMNFEPESVESCHSLSERIENRLLSNFSQMGSRFKRYFAYLFGASNFSELERQ